MRDGVLYSGTAYRDQVFFQLAVERVLGAPYTKELLRQNPDLFQPLAQVLYKVKRYWEKDQSFTASDLVRPSSYRAGETRIDFKAQLDHLFSFLMRDALPLGNSPWSDELVNVVYRNFEPLLIGDLGHGEQRYYWLRSIHSDAHSKNKRDVPGEPLLRSASERERAVRDIQGLANLLLDLGKLTPFDLAYPQPVLDYCPPAELSWQTFDWRHSGDRDIAELHRAILRNSPTLRNLLLLEILGQAGAPPYALSNLVSTIEAFQEPGQRKWMGLMEVANARRKRVLSGGMIPRNIHESLDLMVNIEFRDIARWTAEGQVLLARIRRLS